MLTEKINSDGTVDITGKQGTTWSLIHSCFSDIARTIPFSVDGLLVRGQLRKDYRSTSPVVLELTCSVVPMDIDDNPDNNKISIGAIAEQSSLVSTLSGVYDVEVYNEDETLVERVMEGKYLINPEVTRNII
jgi:hypothetical protein